MLKRAWVMVNIDWTPMFLHRMREGGNRTIVVVRLTCRNEGKRQLGLPKRELAFRLSRSSPRFQICPAWM